MDLILRWPENEPRPEALFRDLNPTRVAASVDGIKEAFWPGITRATRGRDDESASASREPWIDANGYAIQYHRARGQRNLLLTQDPPKEPGTVVPFESVEVALIEARVNGANFALTFDQRYRDALRAGDPKALDAWKSLVTSARWLEANEALFGLKPLPMITMLVEEGDATEEIAKLMYRRGASPWLVGAPPRPSPSILALVAVSLKKVPPAVFDHARAGSTVVLDSKPDPAWKLVRKDEDRTVYSLGKGQVYVYNEVVGDPSEFSLDVIDIITHKRRAARLWNALSAIPIATEAPGGALLHVINYGSPVDAEVQARVQGIYSKAMLLRPGSAPEPLKINKRGSTSEIYLPRLARVATVRFTT
ncbi:MAG: hypothetical protein HY820_18420 [Acidobacteria bacterium]|nr:hypothetical protein [Acidobacteriota bacterium]